MIQYCLWNDTDCTFETKWTRMKYCKPLPWLLVGLWTEAKNTLSFFSVKNFSLFGLLCMNTPFSSPLSIERISIAFSPQPMTSLELLIWLTERGFSPQFKIASWKIIRSGLLVREFLDSLVLGRQGPSTLPLLQFQMYLHRHLHRYNKEAIPFHLIRVKSGFDEE